MRETRRPRNLYRSLLIRAEPLELAEEISHRMVEVERLEDGALWLDVDPAWAGAINAVLVSKGVRVNELREQTAASHLVA